MFRKTLEWIRALFAHCFGARAGARGEVACDFNEVLTDSRGQTLVLDTPAPVRPTDTRPRLRIRLQYRDAPPDLLVRLVRQPSTTAILRDA